MRLGKRLHVKRGCGRVTNGGEPVTSKEAKNTKSTGVSRFRRPCKPMSLTRIGKFDEILRGSTGALGDGGTNKRTNP
jgi:hypothetical protein